ncbi:divalent-cation tolerance protein CutA [Methanonatronarchaeum sp. AMET6-2]|uniref:divalent-cation tolerance protein CutA n=1 Tax=Methanonatronarchaeum sp. AMET6-2 TaxID=2933293 RepID=UPI001203A1E4|nr:divalent-cation tolerance protein CutA [Methanonatronarchaeum sp. AMET6-2]RZN62037.1 MAG: divalent-cation tolerance protein CutA [Methanonatronarchaeia archaeon]UOY10360.1 divalent-cation tolerance protein CutA [Methanonatronarchaeum sp. AMET6-2]
MAKIGYIVTASKKEANEIAEKLVRERLAACANIIGSINSIYWWDNEIQSDTEHALIIKTTDRATEKTKERIKQLHSYENPAIIFIDINETTEEYNKWIKNEVDI